MSDPVDFTLLGEILSGGVTPSGAAHTWTYTPTMSVTVSGQAGVRIAVRLLWESLVAIAHRDSVTFEAGTGFDTSTIGDGE